MAYRRNNNNRGPHDSLCTHPSTRIIRCFVIQQCDPFRIIGICCFNWFAFSSINVHRYYTSPILPSRSRRSEVTRLAIMAANYQHHLFSITAFVVYDAGYDTSAHVAEETSNSHMSTPLSMVGSVINCLLLGNTLSLSFHALPCRLPPCDLTQS